jgi:thiol-disulfide isomerase/thioredoxin
MTNAKKAKQQRASGTRKPPPARGGKGSRGAKGGRKGGSSTGLWIAVAVVAVVLVVLALASTGSSGGTEPSPAGSVTIARASGALLQVGEAIPEWSAPALDGSGTMTWSSYLGKPTVLAIWAPWCPHCQVELPRLSAAVDARPEIQMVSVTTAIDQGTETPDGYMDDNNLSFPVAVDDAAGTLSKGLGVGSFPTTYFVDSAGNVVQATTGEIDEATLATTLDQLRTT